MSGAACSDAHVQHPPTDCDVAAVRLLSPVEPNLARSRPRMAEGVGGGLLDGAIGGDLGLPQESAVQPHGRGIDPEPGGLSTAEDATRFVPSRVLNSEQAIGHIADDEFVEITPTSLRRRNKAPPANRRPK